MLSLFFGPVLDLVFIISNDNNNPQKRGKIIMYV